MNNRLRSLLAPRVEFEQKAYRTRLANRVLVGYFLFLLLWLITSVPLHVAFPPPFGSYDIRLDGLVLLVLAPSGIVAALLLRRERVLASGYVMAGAVLLTAGLSMFVFPEGIYLFSGILALTTLISGALVGGAAAFVFAVASILIGAASWWYARLLPLRPAVLLDAPTGVLYVLALAIVSIATAAILFSLSKQVGQSIVRLHDQAERLAVLANTDSLTGLANRRHLFEQLQREFTRAMRYRRPLSLLYIDLDGFKAVNDKHGHTFGDEVLRGASVAMRSVLRSTDLMARIGGDEFAVLMPETTLASADNVASKLRKALEAYAEQLGPDIAELSFCAGVSQMQANDSAESMLSRADEAQYLAKATGKGHTRTQEELSPLAAD